MRGEALTVVVTGATRGLGLAIARRLARSGYRVIGTGRKPTEEFLALCQPEGDVPAAAFVELELGALPVVSEVGRQISKSYGPIYGLVNNAAIARDGVLATLHHSEIEESVRVNVTGTLLFTKAMLRAILVTGKPGRIINISSIVSHTGYNGLSVYAATKAAMIGFTHSLAREVGRAGITVNAIAPGYMSTEMSSGLTEEQMTSIRRRSPIGRLAEPDDVANTVNFLLSSEAAGITGAVLTVDAGTTA
jgi:3-oxoacyl-[acyl-carrier protein] reductase